MTEIPIFPAGGPPPAIAEPGELGSDLLAALHQVFGSFAAKLPDPQRIRHEKAQHIYVVTVDPIPMTIVGGAGYLSVPQMLGPMLGQHWDVHTISATGFTAGSVQGWKNLPPLANQGVASQGALRFSATSAGFANYGKNQCPLRHGERLDFTAEGITGAVMISLEATCLSEIYLGEYLL